MCVEYMATKEWLYMRCAANIDPLQPNTYMCLYIFMYVRIDKK